MSKHSIKSNWNVTDDAGNAGRNFVILCPSFEKHVCVAGLGSPSPTPPSPDENIKETPRAPLKEVLV